MGSSINNEDQRKRTHDALQRRMKQEEEQADVRLHQQKHHKLSVQVKLKPQQHNNPPSKLASTDAYSVPPIKGNVKLSGNAARQDSDLETPAYFQLFHPVNENLVTADKITNPKSTVDEILLDYLQHGDVAPKYLQAYSKLKKKDEQILLDNFVQKGAVSGEAQSWALKRHAKRSKKHASLKKHKMLGSFDLPIEYHNFERFRPLHEMWKSYISQLLKNIGKDQLGGRLLNADLHGAIILVAHCKESSLSGVNGIIIRETAETFGIITLGNKFRVVPKKLSVFMLQAESWKVTLHGDKLTSRSMVS